MTEYLDNDCTVAKYLLSSKGKNLLVCDDFIFRRKSRLGNRSYWICAYDRGFKCKARLCVLDGSEPPKIFARTGEHNHSRDYERIKAREMVNTMKQMALQTTDSIDQIYSSCISNEKLTSNGLVAMSSKAAVKAAMRRMRTRRRHSKEDASDEEKHHHSQNAFDEEHLDPAEKRRRRRKSTPVKVTNVILETTDEDLTDLFPPKSVVNLITNSSSINKKQSDRNVESVSMDIDESSSSDQRNIASEEVTERFERTSLPK